MVVNHLTRETRCDRCGATKREALLTKSHAPHTAFIKACSLSGWSRQRISKTYTLCERCREVHYELERRILTRVCAEMSRLHEDYVNQ